MPAVQPDCKLNITVKHLRIIAAIVAIACAVFFVPWVPFWTWISPLPDTIQEEINDAIQNGLDGVIVYVDQSGKEPQFYSAGWKNRETAEPADPQALFKIASISKLYLAAATAKLVHADSLSLDDKLADHIPGLLGKIDNADEITVQMLLRHRTGIPNFTAQSTFDWFKPQLNNRENLQLVEGLPADFEPDARYRYSNTNYLLIGAILDTVLGYSHHRYIYDNILAPLRLTHTYNLPTEVNFQNVASGYHDKVNADLREVHYVSPGGSMIATAEDVGIFIRALNDGTLFTDDEQEIYSSVYEYEHTGWLPGYQSSARYHEDLDAVVVQFVSSTGGDSEMISSIVNRRIARLLGRQ